MPLMDWIVDFDARKTAEDNFERLAADVLSGKKGSIENLSLPAGGDYSSMIPTAPNGNVEKTPVARSAL